MDPDNGHNPESPNYRQTHRNFPYSQNFSPQFNPNSPQSPYAGGYPPSTMLHNFHPFVPHTNYPPFSQASVGFQGHQGNMMHSPHGVFGAAAGRSSPTLHPAALFGSAGNASSHSHGSDSDTPQSARQENQAVETEHVLSSEGEEDEERAGVRANWTQRENERLANAWIKHSVDSVDGNGKRAEQYWGQVADEFNANRPANGNKRTIRQLRTHWRIINKSMTAFFGVYSRAVRTWPSGQNDMQLMKDVREWYKGENNGKAFTMEYLFDILKDQPKWKSQYTDEYKNKRTKISSSGAYTSSSNHDTGDEEGRKEKRPEGQKKAKNKQKGKGKGKEEDKPSEDMVLFHDAIGIKSAALVKTAEASKEKTKMAKMQTYLDLLEKDTSSYNEARLKGHQQVIDLLGKELFRENL